MRYLIAALLLLIPALAHAQQDIEQAACGESGTCTECPAYTFFAGDVQDFELESTLRVDDEFVLATFSGCESHVVGSVGSLLLRKSEDGWEIVEWFSGIDVDECVKKDDIICRFREIGQGQSTGTQYRLVGTRFEEVAP